MYAVCQEVVILPLLAIRDDQRACGFEPFDSISNCIFVKCGERGVLAVDLGEFLEEIRRPRNAANGLRGYGDRGWLNVGHACTSHFTQQNGTESCAAHYWVTRTGRGPSVTSPILLPSSLGYLDYSRVAERSLPVFATAGFVQTLSLPTAKDDKSSAPCRGASGRQPAHCRGAAARDRPRLVARFEIRAAESALHPVE